VSTPSPITTHPKLWRTHHRAMLIAVLASVWVYAAAASDPVFAVMGTAAAAIGFWYALQGPSRIARIAINAVLFFVIALALLAALRNSLTVETFALFSMLLMALKLFDLRTPRDHGQVLVLALSLIIAAVLTASDMVTGTGVFLATFVFIRAVVYFRLFATASRDRRTHPPLSTRAAIDLRAMQVVTAFFCILLALVIFLIMPRNLGNSALGQWGGPAAAAVTGFSDDVELGRPGRITTSPTPVMRLTVRDRNDQHIGSPNSRAIYLRGAVLTQYEQGRWLSGQDQRVPVKFRTRYVDPDRSVPIVNSNNRARWTREYDIALESDELGFAYLFAPWLPLEIRINNNPARIGVDNESRMILVSDDPVRSYRVRAIDMEFEPTPIPEGATRTPLTDTDSFIPERVAELARSIVTQAGIDPDPTTRPLADDVRAVRSLETHLRSQFTYTLTAEPVPTGRDATEWFLFDRRTGHCEYYASALTLMTRALGINARVVTGYVAAEYNEVSGSYIVRQSNAHAWVEAQTAPDSWRTFDGTPQADFHQLHEPDPSPLRKIAQLYDAIQQAWVSHVIDYDADTRARILGKLDTDFGLRAMSETLAKRFAAERFTLIRRAALAAVAVFLISMTIGISAVLLLHTNAARDFLTKLRTRQRAPKDPSDRAADSLASRIRDRLRDLGASNPDSAPFRAQAQHLAPEDTTLQSAIATLYAYRYAPHDDTQDWGSRIVSASESLRASR